MYVEFNALSSEIHFKQYAALSQDLMMFVTISLHPCYCGYFPFFIDYTILITKLDHVQYSMLYYTL